MDILSHIQVPRFILKNFHNKYNKLEYFDFESNRIQHASSKSLGANKGYYSEDIEKLLNARYESPLSLLMKSIPPFLMEDKNDSIRVPLDSENTVKEFFFIMGMRSEFALDILMQESYTAKLYNEQFVHDILMLISSRHNEVAERVYKDKALIFFVNKTERNFVVTRNASYSARFFETYAAVLPYSPQIAIGLADYNSLKTFEDGQLNRIYFIKNKNDIDYFNARALVTEYYNNKSFVASATEVELAHLIKFYNEKKTLLDERRLTYRIANDID